MQPAKASAGRSVTLNIRAAARQRDLIDRAAQALGKNRSDFMLETACREAEAVLLDQRYFELDEASHQAFLDRLDRAAPSEKLIELLSTKAPWER